jgi:hypothetical protein
MPTAGNHCVPLDSLQSFAVAVVSIAFLAISLFNSFELLITIFITFRRRAGCYFYSLLVASIGIAFFATFIFTTIFHLINNYISVSFMLIGWCCMVTGQSLVLYSRLHLIVRSSQKLKWVLIMIIINGIILHSTEIGLSLKVSLYSVRTNSAANSIHRRVNLDLVPLITCHGCIPKRYP